jgi:hypothetical protein
MHDFLMWAGGIVISIGAAVTGWVFKMVFTAIKEQREEHDKLKDSLSNHKLHAAETFATKVDVQSGFDRIMLKLENIVSRFDLFDAKLDKKVDK